MNIIQWQRAFRKFMAIYVPTHKHLDDKSQLMADMFTHVDNVIDMYENGGDWYGYDYNFRYLQCTKYQPWSTQKLGLILRFSKLHSSGQP